MYSWFLSISDVLWKGKAETVLSCGKRVKRRCHYRLCCVFCFLVIWSVCLSIIPSASSESNVSDCFVYEPRYVPAFSNMTTIIVWSALHKGGSSALNGIMASWCTAMGAQVIVSHNGQSHESCTYSWYTIPENLKRPYQPEFGPDPDEIIDYALTKMRNITRTSGIACVGSVRNYEPLPTRTNVKYKHIILMRDPRDLVVSAYFSFGWTHNVKKENPIAAAIRSLSCNEYSLSDLPGSASFIKKRFDPLIYLAKNHSSLTSAIQGKVHPPNGQSYARYITSYQSMVLGPNDFHASLARFLEMPQSAAEALISSRKIDIHDLSLLGKETQSHLRAIIPGNYRLHLNASTRRYLRNYFSQELKLYNEIGGFAFEPYLIYNPPTREKFVFDSDTKHIGERKV